MIRPICNKIAEATHIICMYFTQQTLINITHSIVRVVFASTIKQLCGLLYADDIETPIVLYPT